MLDKLDYPCMVRNGNININHENRYLYSENEVYGLDRSRKNLNEIYKK